MRFKFFDYEYALQTVIQEEYLSKLNFQHVIYDEIERFRRYNDDQFNYPYGLRKTSLDTI